MSTNTSGIMNGSKRLVLRDIIDSPPQPGLDMMAMNNSTSNSSGGNTQSASNRSVNSGGATAHRPGRPYPASAGMTAQQHAELLISPSTATTGSSSSTPDRVGGSRRKTSSRSPPSRAAGGAAAAGGGGGSRNSARDLAMAAMTSHLGAAAGGAAANNSNMFLDSDLVSTINTSDGGYQFPQEFRSALSKALFKLEAAEKLLAERQRTIDTERKVFSQRLESMQTESTQRQQQLEQEHKADRTFLVQAKHDRDTYKRQYEDLLELAERREQEQQSESNRWENERVILRKRVEETAASSKSMSQLLDAAQSRIKALEEQLADRDDRLSQLQQECQNTRQETAGFERKIREGLLVDARISQKWLSEADTAKRDNQALCASLVRAMNLLSRTVEYGQLVTKGQLGEGFVYCGADPNVNFGSQNVATASSSAAVLESLVRDTNALLRSAATHVNPGQPPSAPLPSTPGSQFPSVFDQSVRATGLRVEKLRCESDFWIPKAAYDLLNRLLGWMEHACALKITPQVEVQLLPAIHEWFVVLNAVWRERMESKVRGAVQQHVQKAERDAEKKRASSSSSAPSGRFPSVGGGDSSTHFDAAGAAGDGSSADSSSKDWNPPPYSVSIPVRRTSDRLKQRIEEAKRLSWANGNSSGAAAGANNNNSGKRNNNTPSAPLLQRWTSIAIDGLQSILDLEKTVQSQQQKELQQQQQQQQEEGGIAGSRGRDLVKRGVPVMDAREVEESLRNAAGPVSMLQELSEQIRWNVENFRDALDAANPDENVTTTDDDDDDDASENKNKNNNNKDKKSLLQEDPEARVPLVLLMTVHDIAAQFCDAVDDSCVSLQKAQFDIDRALNGLGDALTTVQRDSRRGGSGGQQQPQQHLNESRNF